MTPDPVSPGPARPFLVLGIVLTSVFVQLLDISIVNVAIPSIQADLGASTASIQLVLAGYQLAFACLLITAARLGDIHGRRRLFLAGMTVFTVASLLCGLAPDPGTLVVARVVQGLGSGLMFPQVLAVIQVTFTGPERGRAFGIFGATIGIATICGPLLAAGVPAGQVDRVVDCYETRARSSDPSALPPGCAPEPGPLAGLVGAAAAAATAQDYQYAIERTLLFEVGVFGVATLLVRRLPSEPLRRRPVAAPSSVN